MQCNRVKMMSSSSNDDECPSPISSKRNKNMLEYTSNKLGMIVYRECLKNHAASLGGNARDGCCEFMPMENHHHHHHHLICSACGCHRNFHRRDQVVDVVGVGLNNNRNRKRRRTRFTREQKEKMLGFAEKAEWKIQTLDEGYVQQFCGELQIETRVLKVWMHNNKKLHNKNQITF